MKYKKHLAILLEVISEMNKSMTARYTVEITLGALPQIYSPQSTIVKGTRADGMEFKVDIGRVCYFDRENDSDKSLSGKHYKAKSVGINSLSQARIKWVKNYLYMVFNKVWRDETARQHLTCVRYFLNFCDFNDGIKPNTLDELVSEYQRYQILLDQRGRINGKSSLNVSTITSRLTSARMFIQYSFELSDSEILAIIPRPRSRQNSGYSDSRLPSLIDGQNYLQACYIYFNQFSDAILGNQYPISVTPPNSVETDLYWYSGSGAGLVSLPNCFNQNGEPLPFEEIKKILNKNFKSERSYKSGFYERALVRNRNAWRGDNLSSQKIYAFNLSTFCFFQIYLGFTGANVQPTLDLKISDIDLQKIGTSTFAKKHKFRAGREVNFTAPSQLKREIIKYFKLREWAEDIVLLGDASDYLFVSIGEDKKLKRFSRDVASNVIKKTCLFEGITRISSMDVRHLTGEYFIRKSKGKISLVAKKLNNSIATVAKNYTAIDIETQAIEMNVFHEEFCSKVRMFNRTTTNPIPVIITCEESVDRITSGSCVNIEGDIPLKADGFNTHAPQPACGTFESCLFCEHFAVNNDFEDIHKLLSLREALERTSMIRNDPEHHQAAVQPALFRIDEIIEYVGKTDLAFSEIIDSARAEIYMGNYSKHWARQIEQLNDHLQDVIGRA